MNKNTIPTLNLFKILSTKITFLLESIEVKIHNNSQNER